MLVLHFACIRSGALFVPLNWRLVAAEISFMIDDCEPALIVLEPMFANLVENTSIPRIVLDDSAEGLAARMQAASAPSAPGYGVAVEPDAPITLL